MTHDTHALAAIEHEPLVSVAICNYNYARYLACAIDSALAQDYRSVEVVVVDDGSTDQSRAIISSYGVRVVAVFTTNHGHMSAANTGYAASRGALVLFLDSDDLLAHDTVRRCVMAFRSCPEAAKVHFRLADITAAGQLTGATRPPLHWPLPQGELGPQIARWHWQAGPPSSGIMFARKVLASLHPWPGGRDQLYPDAYLGLAAGMLGTTLGFDGIGGYYRIHATNSYETSQLDLDWVRREINRTTLGHPHLRRVANSVGLEGYPAQPDGLRGIGFLSLRMISRKLDPTLHPLPSDTTRSLALHGARAGFGDPSIAWRQALQHVLWFSLMPILPRRFAVTAATWRLFPNRRPARAARRHIPVIPQAGAVAYLSPTYQGYRVPVFEKLDGLLGRRLTVVSLDRQTTTNDRIAQTSGAFRRRAERGWYPRLSRRHHAGEQTPTGLLVTPGFPIALLRLRPVVVIGNNFNLWTLTALALRYPTIVFWEGTPHTERTVARPRLWTRRWVAARARGFVVTGTLAKRYLMDTLGVPERLILKGGLCADRPNTSVCAVTRRLAGHGAPLRVLFVGRLIVGKGVDQLVRAAAVLSQAGVRNFEMTIVGDGPESRRLRRLVDEYGLSCQIRLAGRVAPQDVWRFYLEHHVFVLPTLQDNWPLVVAEAMSIGMPVLLSRFAGSHPDLVEEGGNGHVFDPPDHERLATLLRGYIDHPEQVERHGARSLELIAPYTPERCAGVLHDAVERVLRRAW